MNEYDEQVAPAAVEDVEPERVRTGVAAVDTVIDSVDDLRERPLSEHPAVFEAAHERLRRALDPAAAPVADPAASA